MTRPIEIIAELGINWNGNIQTAENLIQIAREAGADVAKFQLYDPRKRPDIDSHPYKEQVLQSRISRRKLFDLKQICDRNDIEFMCSVIDVDKVDWTEEIGMKRYKIASKSIYDEELAKRISGIGKEVIVSWGYFNPNNNYKPSFFGENTKNLYCISKYPAQVEDYADLRVETIFSKDDVYKFDGISDHTEGLTVAVTAMARGARIVEKHITMDKDQDGPDHCFSLIPDELRLMCKTRDEIEKILYL